LTGSSSTWPRIGPHSQAVGDFNGDGKTDLAIGNNTANTVSILLNNSTPVINLPPVAKANGPYSVPEGSSVVLSSAGSNDPDGSIASYEWDFDYDGATFDLNATGAAPTFSAAGLDGPTMRTVALRVTDNLGAKTIDTATVNVNNVAPTFDAGPNTTLPTGGGEFSRTTIPFTDPGTLDVHKVTVSYGDGSGDQTTTLPLGTRTFNLNHTYAASGLFTVTVTVKDDDLGSHTDTFEVTVVLNRPPTANANGPYVRNEGESFQLDASASSDKEDPNSLLRFEWDLDYDGFTFDVDVMGERPTVVFADNFSPRTIAVRVTDSGGLSNIATTTLEIKNVRPEITDVRHNVAECGNVAAGGAVTIAVDFRDPGFDDPARGTMENFTTSTIDWGDGTVETLSISKSNGSPGVFTTGTASGTHTYRDGGIYIITVTLIDDDGGVAQLDTMAFVSGVAPPDAHAGTLYIIGTPGRDQVSVNKQGNGLLKVHADFLPSGNFRTFNLSAVNKIIAYLCDGDDQLTIAGNITIPAIVHGGGGNDH
jgi:hypothetical protein